jgi:hypothetical protein
VRYQYGPVWFVVNDFSTCTANCPCNPSPTPPGIRFDDPLPSSDNHSVVRDEDIIVQQVPNMNTFQVTVAPIAVGEAGITITATDQDCNRTSTSFVLDVIDGSTDTPPSITGAGPTPPTWIEQDVTQSSSAVYHFTVSDSETPKKELLVTAVSSNANLVPNSVDNLVVTQPDSNGSGSVKIIPKLPLPSPSPGVPQAATITLSVTDSDYTRRMQFLYVAKNPNFPPLSFSRPTGVYNANADSSQDQPSDPFLTGAEHQISWKCIESSENDYNWCSLDGIFPLPNGQTLSINLIEEPCYVAQGARYTWCDTSHNPFTCPSCGSPTPTPTPCMSPPLSAAGWTKLYAYPASSSLGSFSPGTAEGFSFRARTASPARRQYCSSRIKHYDHQSESGRRRHRHPRA